MREPPDLEATLRLVLAVWLLLACGGLLRPWLGAHGAAALSFAACGALVLAARRERRAPVTPARVAALLLAFAAGIASLGTWVAVLAPVGRALGLPPRAPMAPFGSEPLLWLAAAVLAPLFEELLYRERLLPALAPHAGRAGALVLSSAAFALPHLEPWSLLAAFACGLLLGSLFLATRSVALCIAYHAGVNVAVGLSGVPPSGALLGPLLQPLLVCAAFWVALAGVGVREADPALQRRAAIGLLLGALLAHAGQALLHADFRPLAGASVLFVPFGVLAAAPARGDPRRVRYLASAFLALVPALAVARAGCLARGCCYAGSGAAVEIAALLLLYVLARRWPAHSVAPRVLAALVLLRLALAPLRAF
jgi:membrane protease YdiL (CAAX protease family)